MGDALAMSALRQKWPEIESRWNEGVRDLSSSMVVGAGLASVAQGASAGAGQVHVGSDLYRVSGGGSPVVGTYWTPMNPSTTAQFAARAGLPTQNAMTTVARAVVMDRAGLRLAPAAAGARGGGGLPEVRALDSATQLKVVTVRPFIPRED
jgi:hypothetical protein